MCYLIVSLLSAADELISLKLLTFYYQNPQSTAGRQTIHTHKSQSLEHKNLNNGNLIKAINLTSKTFDC